MGTPPQSPTTALLRRSVSTGCSFCSDLASRNSLKRDHRTSTGAAPRLDLSHSGSGWKPTWQKRRLWQGRSADFQSAVSPICNWQDVQWLQSAPGCPRSAEYNSAERQIENLRYGL